MFLTPKPRIGGGAMIPASGWLLYENELRSVEELIRNRW
jgi:hypothetical protein